MNLLEKYPNIFALEPTSIAECGIIKFLAEKFPENFEYSLINRETTKYSSKDFRREHHLNTILIIKDFKDWVSGQVTGTITWTGNDGEEFTGYGNMTYGSTESNSTSEDLTGSVLKKDEDEAVEEEI